MKGEKENKDKLSVFSQIAEVIEKDSSMIIKNPVLGDVVFANGTLGNLEKKNTGGFGIKHIIDGRYRKDGLDEKEISALLYLMKDVVESQNPENIEKPKINLVKNGIWVGITRNWGESDEKWIVTGYGETDTSGKMIKEAADAIKAVNAQYGYAPEFLSVGRQVGAVITSIDKITQINEKSTSTEQSSESKVLYGKTTVNVDGLECECEHGVLDGFKNAVKMVDRLKEENIQLKKENIELHKRLSQKSHSKNHNEKEIER